ncbi:hypothetical protein HXX76_014295 [Chlamydomonas incerta]|uniref:Uncharacterized protein n=1 Tax=Chlamydomonas incerta TaxID=51695 RepID=A0A835SD18_CHLIN|nr:hypothetical protein HXX76_014295 [Chlamydomonas incerta]|eukprot:KAG2424719.1 hypothetical protein HXX76_014295 [Chlamydomonas incerta]
MADRGVVGVAERPSAGNEQQVEQLEQQRRRAELRRKLRALGLEEWKVGIFSDANLDLMLREHFVNLASFRTGLQVGRLLLQAGLPPCLAGFLAEVLNRATAAELAALRGGVAGHGGSSSSAAGPSAGPQFAAQATPAQHDTDAGRVRDQQPPRGGSSASKGWWSGWLPAVPPLMWSTQPPQSSQPLLPGSALSQPNDAAATAAAAVAAAAAAVAVATAVATATPSHTHKPAVAARGDADLRDAACSVSAAASLAPPASQLSACRRRHVHRPALGQQE